MQLPKIVSKSIIYISTLLAIIVAMSYVMGKHQTMAQTSRSLPLDLYRSYGFPAPDDPLQLTDEQLYRWNNFLRPHAEKAASLVGVDVGLIGMWAMIENHITSHMDNCYDGNTNLHSSADFDPNTHCGGWGGNWQVGYGMHPAYEYGYVKEAYEKMRPGQSIQAIGQRVIDTSTDSRRYSSSLPYINKPYNTATRFPNVTLDDMINGAIDGDSNMRWALGTFMKDDAISAYVIAKKYKSYVDSNDQISVAARIEGWSGNYNRQRIINVIAGIYNAGASSWQPSDDFLSRSNPITIRIGRPSADKPNPGEVPTAPSDIRQGIITEFGITMNGFSSNHLQWAWEKFWEVSNTNFNNYVRGTTIQAVGSGSQQKGCQGSHPSGVDVDLQLFEKEFFKFLLIHELGHIVRNCNLRETIQYTQHRNAINTEGGVSYYGNNAAACTGSDNESEDYADMIAYYLTPSAGLSTVGNSRCNAPQQPPNPFFSKSPSDFPLHLRVAETVLKR